MPTPYLEWIDKKDRTRRLEIVDKVFIGRSCKGVDPQKRILVRDAQVSRDHAVISRRAKFLQITDSSKNGTWVNGVRLAAGSSSDVSDGDIIGIGESTFSVHYPESVTDTRDKALLTAGTIVTPSEVVVTNMVADVREFTTFSQAHDSAAVYSLMKEIFETFSTIVSKFKGTIKDYAGDAVYAFWDHYLEPVDGQAVLACRAAVHQLQTIKEIRMRLSEKGIDVENLQMGWGITTGKVTMSHYGSRSADLALVGDCTNLAFRLSGMANKELSHKIVICAQTAELVRNDLAVNDLGSVPIKGRTGREHIFGLDVGN
jgi:class 3 adenylate cyclase